MSSGSRPPRPPILPERAVWIDGTLRRGPEATLSVFDRGARDGEGLFETLRIYRGRPFLWREHLERLVVSAAELGFPVPASPRTLHEALEQVLTGAGLADAVARLTVTRGVPSGGRGRRTRAGAWVEAEPIGARLWPGARNGAARAVLSKRPFELGPLGRYKTTSRLAYHLAREEARAARADEALLVSPRGLVLEGSVSNLFVVSRGRVITPALELGILPGITRRVVLGLCAKLGLATEERSIELGEFGAAEEVFVTNSVQEVVPMSRVEDRLLASTEVGSHLAAGYRDEVARLTGLEVAGDSPSSW